jgi:ABC-2 type transport system permease protein/oleandomycin transport system permease protein
MSLEASLIPSHSDRQSIKTRLAAMFADTIVITWRNLLGYIRIPEAAFFSSVQPIMFVLLFRYVFGGAIHPPVGTYVDYLIPGIFVQTVAFGAVGTAIGLAQDLQTGIIERFRALPMSRSAVLAGRTVADLVRNVFVVIIITGVGFAVGFRVHTDAGAFIAGLGILLLFAFTLSWGFALIGLLAPNAETAQVMSFPILFPLTFASTAFVPVQTMPGWLQPFVNNQPVSIIVDSARALMEGGPTESYVWKAIVWSVGILLVLGPLAVRRYRRAT